MSITIPSDEFAVGLAIAIGIDVRQTILDYLADHDLWIACDERRGKWAVEFDDDGAPIR